MSRSGYSDDCDGWIVALWRGAVASATKGVRGQKMLAELLTALDAKPVKRLIKENLAASGEVCAMGCLGQVRGLDMAGIDPEDPDQVAEAFGIAPALAREIAYMNDERGRETPEECWTRMRRWVAQQIVAMPERKEEKP